MREYGQVQSAFWQSEDAGKLTDQGKLLAVYLLTGPMTNGVGCFRLMDGSIHDDLKWSPEKVSETLSELFAIGFAIRLDGVVFIPKFLHWNKIINGNIAKARFGDWEAITKGKPKSFAARAMLEFCDMWIASHRSILETVSQMVTETTSELFRNGMANHDSQVENQHPTPPHPNTPQNILLVRNVKLKGNTSSKVEHPAFAEFWSIYPRHVSRKAASTAFTKAIDGTDAGTIFLAIRKQAASFKWRSEPQFIPHAATWLNGRRWEDEIETAVTTNGHAIESKPRQYHTAPKLDDPSLITGSATDKQKTDQVVRDLARKLRIP